MIIAIDTIGGEMTPEQIVRGVILAAAEKRENQYILVGNEPVLARLLQQFSPEKNLPIIFVNTNQSIYPDEDPISAIRKKPNASIFLTAQLVLDKKADAMLSVGNVGACVAACRHILKLAPGIRRPALAVKTPSISKESILIDAGANIHTTALDLLNFAKMGVVFAETMLDIHNPKVGLLSVGQEDTKGNELIKEAVKLFKNSTINFAGNIEGSDVYKEKVDVIVASGFAGHVAWKVGESLISAVHEILDEQINKNVFRRIGKYLARSTFETVQKKANADEYGGAPLLGIQGNCIITIPTPSAYGIKKAFELAELCAQKQVNQHIMKLFLEKQIQIGSL